MRALEQRIAERQRQHQQEEESKKPPVTNTFSNLNNAGVKTSPIQRRRYWNSRNDSNTDGAGDQNAGDGVGVQQGLDREVRTGSSKAIKVLETGLDSFKGRRARLRPPTESTIITVPPMTVVMLKKAANLRRARSRVHIDDETKDVMVWVQ